MSEHRRSHHSPIEHIAVVIPARDEQETIVRALAAVLAASSGLDAHVTCSCVVVADGCRDETAAVARAWSALGEMPCTVLECSERSVGAARGLGTSVAIDHALRRGVEPARLWLAHTDADTVVGTDWLALQLRIADRGVDAVAGIVELDESAPAVLARRFRSKYHLGPNGTHTHVHGANMAMRATTYLDAEGWDARRTGEDHDLWHRLASVGTCVSSTAIVVRTSARLIGRAPNGFSADVRSLACPEGVA